MNTNHDEKSFSYTYSAKEQSEIRHIRAKYLPPEEDKMARIRRLDASVQSRACMLSLIIGILGAAIDLPLRFEQRCDGILVIITFTVEINKIKLAVQQELAQLVLGKIRHLLAHFGKEIRLIERVAVRQARKEHALCFQTISQHLGQIARKAALDHFQRQIIISRALHMGDILGQGTDKRCKITVRHINTSHIYD